MHPEVTRVGEWVNVMGYVADGHVEGTAAHVQALIVWATGPFDVRDYEKAVGDGLLE
ncbi:Telomere length regulation/capping, TEN1 [Moelleriella libera RCEF 2490]|uniref:Telomere length regulation/capping, TEN1 n=1 Tax=Moelleriella libera RCEF 2490 TaxID=1081109 RepID=A0A166VDD0_9HYPO|nr:Telomere length regulation/capping, TEN1 [Moelleriella libera RCEF 2490]